MKPHRLKLTHHLILTYGLYRKMECYVCCSVGGISIAHRGTLQLCRLLCAAPTLGDRGGAEPVSLRRLCGFLASCDSGKLQGPLGADAEMCDSAKSCTSALPCHFFTFRSARVLLQSTLANTPTAPCLTDCTGSVRRLPAVRLTLQCG